MKGSLRCRGVTLVELLAAMALSALVLVLASRIFLSGNREFFRRAAETDRLEKLIRLKAAVQRELRGGIAQCGGGRLRMQGKGPERDIGESLKARFSALQSWEFRCYEADEAARALSECREGSRPGLVEYRLVVGRGDGRDTLRGSWLP